MSNEQYNNEMEDLEYTRKIRKNVVTELTSKGIPVGDTDHLRILATILTDMDRASLGKMKIKSEDSNSKNNIDAQSAIATMLAQVDPSRIKLAGKSDRQTPVLGNDIPSPIINPGETAIGTQSSSYDEFASKHFTQDNQ